MEIDSIDAPSPTVLRDTRFDSNRPLLASSQENSADADSIDEAPAAALRSLDSNRPSMVDTEAVMPSAEKPLLMFEDDFVLPSASALSKSADSEKAPNQSNNGRVPPSQPGSLIEWRLMSHIRTRISSRSSK